MINKAFELITSKVGAALSEQGFARQKVEAGSDNELTALYVSDTTAYSVVYYKDKMRIQLSSCPMTDDGPSNEWKRNATWMFDPEANDMSDAESIARDFCDSLTSDKAIKRVKQQKKVKKEDEGNADPMFFSKRLVGLFPDLRAEIKEENDTYDMFRGVTFTREKIVPKINMLLARNNQDEIDKLVGILNTQYRNGDMDTRSIITIVILNSVDEKYFEALEKEMSKDLKHAWGGAKHFKGKKVKPEKIKKPKKTTDDPERLENKIRK